MGMLLLPTRPRRRYVPMMAALAFIDVAACCGVMAMEVVWNLDSIADIRAWVRIKTPPEDPILATLPLGARTWGWACLCHAPACKRHGDRRLPIYAPF